MGCLHPPTLSLHQRHYANDGETRWVKAVETFDLAYDAEGHLVTVTKGGNTVAQFTYDGDGKRVKSVEGSETILFVGGYYEIKNPGSGQEVTKYYLAGATRVAVRKYTVPASSELTYLLGDHLGSTSLVTDETGALLVETRYKACPYRVLAQGRSAVYYRKQHLTNTVHLHRPVF